MNWALFFLAQVSSGQAMVPDKLPEVLWGAWDLSEEACADGASLTRIEFGPNWMRDNLGAGMLQFYTHVTPKREFDEALEARFVMGGDAGIRDQQVLLNFGRQPGKHALLWFDSQGAGHIDDANQPIELVGCAEVQTRS